MSFECLGGGVSVTMNHFVNCMAPSITSLYMHAAKSKENCVHGPHYLCVCAGGGGSGLLKKKNAKSEEDYLFWTQTNLFSREITIRYCEILSQYLGRCERPIMQNLAI